MADPHLVEYQVGSELVLGVDFGTSFASAAVYDDGELQLVLDGGDAAIPNAVYVPRAGSMIAGKEALRAGQADPAGLIPNVKRLLRAPSGSVNVRGIELAPTQIAAAVFARLRMLAEARFGARVNRAVITVPAERNPHYAGELAHAANLAGMGVVEMVSEAVAGVMAYGIPYGGERRIAVADFGGGKLDVTLVKQRGMRFSSRGTAGDGALGGDDFDLALAAAVDDEVLSTRRASLRDDPVQWSRLVARCERVKRQLSSAASARLSIPEAGESDLLIQRRWIEPRWRMLADRAARVLDDLLASSGWEARSVDRVVLIGGTTLVPVVLERLSESLERMLVASPLATLAVARGAAMLATRHATVARPAVEAAS